MQLGLAPLFRQIRDAPSAPYVLATVVGTQGSAYRKSGAMMLLRRDAEPVGLVSGGCLESDLRGHAEAVFDDGKTRFVTYDLSQDDAQLWGLGLGCGGAIEIMLEAAGKDSGYAGLGAIYPHWHGCRFCWLCKSLDPIHGATPIVTAEDASLPPAATQLLDATRQRARAARDALLLLIPVQPPLRMTVCGAGPDALPLVSLALISGWRVAVIDHRPALASRQRFDAAAQVQCHAMQALDDAQQLLAADALIIMSHHLENDATYLRAALRSEARYIGLLGPVARRDEVLRLAQADHDPRLYGPAGLAIGADLPETIALSILAQAHAVVRGAHGGSLV